ncbi:MAG: hypothetical protein KF812_07155 [Fimbriimonadaceae bacterium]|nr:hypothetical protein [Fimbriimonadaceae bacterium]
MSAVQAFPCVQCGADLQYAPGTTHMRCPYCGTEQAIAPPTMTVEERDMLQAMVLERTRTAVETDNVVHCNSCAAEFVLPPTIESTNCPFCGSNVVVEAKPESRILPDAVLPFVVDQKGMRDRYRQWIGSRFWAPNDLKKRSLQKNEVQGIYVPFWTYDALTRTDYTGMRGEDYYETETYRDSNGNTQTRTVTKTRWYPAAGRVEVNFDDVLVIGTTHLPPKYADNMRTWRLDQLTPYNASFLSGFSGLRYDINLEQGYTMAQRKMEPPIDQAIRYDIGGDRQQITSKHTEYFNITFKHVLLPIWSGAYRYKGRVWHFFVNGQTGEVQGEAPVSAWKVALAVLLGLILIGTFIYFTQRS